jgi:hypothetical protein
MLFDSYIDYIVQKQHIILLVRVTSCCEIKHSVHKIMDNWMPLLVFINYFPPNGLLYLLLLLSDHYHLRVYPLYSGLPSPKTKFRHLYLSLVSSSVSPWLVMLSHFVIRSHLNNYTINSQALTRTTWYAILYENISRSWTSGSGQSFVSVYCYCSVCVNTSGYE